jgi:hypothetical protein
MQYPRFCWGSDSSIASWSEDEDRTEQRENEIEVDREIVSDKTPSTQQTGNFKWKKP